MSSRHVVTAGNRSTEQNTSTHLDLSHVHAVNVLPKQCQRLHLIQIGCGGIGAFLGIHVARLAREFKLLASRGSDFHGPGESPYQPGELPALPDNLTPVWSVL